MLAVPKVGYILILGMKSATVKFYDNAGVSNRRKFLQSDALPE